MQYEDEQAVLFTVSTFRGLRENTEDIIRWFDVYIEKFTVNQRKPQYFGVGYIDGRDKIRKYNRKSWDSIKKSLYEGEIKDLLLTFYTTDEELEANRFCPDAMLQVIPCTKQIHREDEQEYDMTYANEFMFQMKKDIFVEDIDSIISFFKEVYVKLNGIYGHMDYLKAEGATGASGKSPIESVMAINSFIESNFDQFARGYFWGNILNETHVEALGGEEYVKSKIPHYTFEVLNTDGEKAYYIQLTEDIFTFEPEKYLALKEFLKPLLPKEDMRTITLYDYDGKYRVLDRLVFNEEDTAKLLEAKEYAQNELRDILY